jgi:hypothetical protein
MQLPSFSQLLSEGDKSVFEPTVPSLIKESAFFVNTVGMREAPERLILELFREVFFKSVHHEGTIGARELLPQPEQSKAEQALLHIDRGRTKKKSRQAVEVSSYHGPLYPEIARNAWLRKKTDRVIKFQLLEGPFAQYLKDNKLDTKAFSEQAVKALAGKPRLGGNGSDVFKEMLAEIPIDRAEAGMREEQDAIGELANLLGNSRKDVLDLDQPDELAIRITQDFQHLCRLEGCVPRLLWIELLKSFLRTALPAWLLGHMRLTVCLRDWALAAFGGKVATHEDVLASITNRWQGIFHPTQTGSNEIPIHIERYIKARVELSILIYLMRHALGSDTASKPLAVSRSDKDHISIDDWLVKCKLAGESLGLSSKTSDEVRTEIITYAQHFGAWLNPAANGQGKNIEEFLRIFLRLSAGDNDTGYLLSATRTGGFKGAVVFPGPAILRLMLYLAALEKMSVKAQSRGKLVLADLEAHFAKYGVDFASSVGARPKLISELSQLGLLKGSPDAGDSAELIVPENVELAVSGYCQ